MMTQALMNTLKAPNGPWFWRWAVLLEVGAVVALALHAGILAAGLHGAAALLWLLRQERPPSVRLLHAIVTLVLPAVGLPVTAWMDRTRGRHTFSMMHQRSIPSRVRITSGEVTRLQDQLADVEVILSGDVFERQSVLRKLARQCDARAMVLLRMAAHAPQTEVVVDGAMAMDAMNVHVQNRVQALRHRTANHPGLHTRMHAGRELMQLLHSGVVDGALAGALEQEATTYLQRAFPEARKDSSACLLPHAREVSAEPPLATGRYPPSRAA